jgi:hypothetical protein
MTSGFLNPTVAGPIAWRAPSELCAARSIADTPDWRFGQAGRATVKPSWLAAAAMRSS